MRNRALHGTCPHGGHDSLSITDYFTAAQSWTVETASGASSNTAQAIYEASQAEATAKEGIKAAAKNRARADFAAPWIAYGWE